MSIYSRVKTLPETEDKNEECFTIDLEPFDTIIDRLKIIRAQLQTILRECSEEETNE